MSEPEILFEVNASQILAKMHLAGLQPCSYDKNKEFIVNTGIKNDDPNAKPDNPGKVEFDLGNSQGEYEIGYVTEIGPYSRTIGGTNLIEQLSQLIAKLKTIEGDKSEETDEKGLLDKTKADAKSTKEDEKKKEIIEQIRNLLMSEDNKDMIAAMEIQIAQTKIEDIRDEKDFYEKFNKMTSDDLDAFIKELSEKNKNFEKDNKSLETLYNNKVQDAQNKAIENLQKYLTVFVGPDKIKDFKSDNVVMINISDKIKDSNDSNLVKNFEIIPISDKDKELMLKDFETHPDKCIEKVCFKTGYTIQLDK